MRLTKRVDVPMGCPECGGEEFYILASHPLGSLSTIMFVRCEECGRQFYTDCGVFAASMRAEAEALVAKIKEKTT